MHKIVFATNNQKKLKEVKFKLKGVFEVLSLTEIGFLEEIDETGLTFNENSFIKANYISSKFGINCFADDSGLEVEALNNEPGIFSARYAGKHGDDEANNHLLLKNLLGLKNRNARFVTCICLVLNKQAYYFEGIIEGVIANEFLGKEGFGYDPLFIPKGKSITFAQMSLEQKSEISHRAIAVNKLVDFLKLKG